MKYTITSLILIAGAATLACAPTLSAGTHKRASAPIIITPPAVPDGSNASRAPFPAARPQNDVTPPNGEAFDQNVAPNTPSTTPQPEAAPPATVAILQSRVAPGLMPTGRPTVGASAALDATHVDPMIRSAAFESRDDLIDNIRVRVRQSETTVGDFRRTEGEMSETGRNQFQSQASEVRAHQKALDKSLRAAGRASSSNWETARQQLMSDYDAYAASLAQLDATVGVAPAR